jgi:hypothetical protein
MTTTQSTTIPQTVSKGEIALLILAFLKEEKLQQTEAVFCKEAQKLLYGMKSVQFCLLF